MVKSSRLQLRNAVCRQFLTPASIHFLLVLTKTMHWPRQKYRRCHPPRSRSACWWLGHRAAANLQWCAATVPRVLPRSCPDHHDANWLNGPLANQVYTPTIGPELRVVQLASRSARKGDPTIFLELLEVAHQELRSPRLAGYLEDIHGAIVVFDISEQVAQLSIGSIFRSSLLMRCVDGVGVTGKPACCRRMVCSPHAWKGR